MKVKDYVVHKGSGICQITDIVELDFSGEGKENYYMLVPIEDVAAKVYVPVDNATARCREVISKEEAYELIHSIGEIETVQIDNDKEREKLFKTVLSDGDLHMLVSVIKNLYHRRKDRALSGKKNTVVDDKYFKLAEHHLYQELSLVLEKSEDEIKEMIKENAEK